MSINLTDSTSGKSIQIAQRIVFVTGTRADYGKLSPLAVEASKHGFEVVFFVTGMHMLSKYGLTKIEVHNSGFSVSEYINQRDGDPQDVILCKTMTGFSDFVREVKPDLVVIHGDRVEALACALVCSINYIRIAHVEGGEVSGTIDEVFRHCNTKLSFIHLVSSEAARHRVIRMGESPLNVKVIGSPELDIHCRPSGVTLGEVLKYYKIEAREYGICIFHPVTSEENEMYEQSLSLFNALIRSNRYFVVIMPNNDPGSQHIVSVIKDLPHDQFRVLPSMRFNYFSELMKNASVFLGNSSAGVREAPFFGVPSLNIGTRQLNRSSASSITHVSATDSEGILSFIRDEWNKRYKSNTEFGSGSAATRFVEVISDPLIWKRPMQKFFFEPKDDN